MQCVCVTCVCVCVCVVCLCDMTGAVNLGHVMWELGHRHVLGLLSLTNCIGVLTLVKSCCPGGWWGVELIPLAFEE